MTESGDETPAAALRAEFDEHRVFAFLEFDGNCIRILERASTNFARDLFSVHINGGDFFCADPLETLKFCRTLTSQILMRPDYLPHHFTIFMFKD